MTGMESTRPQKAMARVPQIWDVQRSAVSFEESDSNRIGKGGFGTVYKGVWEGLVNVAVKLVEIKESSSYNKEQFEHEARVWYNMSSPHILPLYGVLRSGGNRFFISPIEENGDAMAYLWRKPWTPEVRKLHALQLLHDAACAMDYLHEMDVIHADLKPAQLLVNSDGRGLLTDFGFAKVMAEAQAPTRENGGSIRLVVDPVTSEPANFGDATETSFRGGRTGTLSYMSPNRLNNGHTVKADDVYSFGVTIYVIWTGIEAHIAYWRQLQDDWTYRVDKVCDGVRPKLPEGLDIPVALIRLMEECWANNPAVRPPFSEVKVRIKKILDELDEHNSHQEAVSSLASSTSPYDSLSRDDLKRALEDTNLPKRPDKLIDVDAALLLYKQGAKLGIPSAQERLAFFYRYGLGCSSRDLVEAAKWYRQAAEHGKHPQAHYELGMFYSEGVGGLEEDKAEAVKWWTAAASQGHPRAQYSLAIAYDYGRGVAENPDEANKWYLCAAEQGIAYAQQNLGYAFANGRGVERDGKKAIEWYSKAADQGVPDGFFNIGSAYETGLPGVPQDFAMAAKWKQKAAELGDPDAQNDLGNFYQQGKGVEMDEQMATKWHRRAAEQGDAKGQCNMGLAYWNGIGVDQDDGVATDWFYLSAIQGFAQSQFNLGVAYAVGRGVEKDLLEAVKWWQKAAEQGYMLAQQNLGWAFETGTGFQKDVDKAIEWYAKAAEQGDEMAVSSLARLKPPKPQS